MAVLRWQCRDGSVNVRVASVTNLLQQQAIAAASLQLYRGIWLRPVGRAWYDCVCRAIVLSEHLSFDMQLQLLQDYGRWFQLLAQQGLSWSEWLIEELLLDDNPFSRQTSAGSLETVSPAVRAAARHDLQRLHHLWLNSQELSRTVAALTGEVVVDWDGTAVMEEPRSERPIARQLHAAQDWGDCLQPLADYYRQSGVGLFGRYRAARWQGGDLRGVTAPDAVAMEEIYGCDRQKKALSANVEALLARRPALNVLLYGARGTGKSSLVKSLLTGYGDRGLRLVELSRSDLGELLAVVDRLSAFPQSFVLFIDDLSFAEDETDFKQLKVMLEGDVAARPENVCLCATSNRRHLVKELFADRPNPSDREVHAWDTMQEKLSLSDRFGLTLTFPPFSQANYFETVGAFGPAAGNPAGLETVASGSVDLGTAAKWVFGADCAAVY